MTDEQLRKANELNEEIKRCKEVIKGAETMYKSGGFFYTELTLATGSFKQVWLTSNKGDKRLIRKVSFLILKTYKKKLMDLEEQLRKL